MRNARYVWIGAIVIGILVHLDWHLGRPGHHSDLSFGSPWHWLTGIVAGLAAVWAGRRANPQDSTPTAITTFLFGILLGQGLEPLFEVVAFHVGWEPFTNALRWKLFGLFCGAAAIVMVLGAFGRRDVPDKGLGD